MGASPYWYTVNYQEDVEAALEQLREREFQAGRYNPVIPFPSFPVTAASPAPGAQHATIEEVFADADADGTRSILDIQRIGPEPDFFTAASLPDRVLQRLFGTTRPTREQVEDSMDFMEDIERGQAVYIILYRDGKPDEILFVGYSFD